MIPVKVEQMKPCGERSRDLLTPISTASSAGPVDNMANHCSASFLDAQENADIYLYANTPGGSSRWFSDC